MTCTKHFLNLEWQHHDWRRRVVDSEVLAAQDSDMWGRTVYRDYVRCDKVDVCEACGAVRHEKSCLCEPATADQCALYQEWRARSSPAAK
jgi:threonine synthase